MSETSTPAELAPSPWERVRNALLDLHPLVATQVRDRLAGAALDARPATEPSSWFLPRKVGSGGGAVAKGPLRDALEAAWVLSAAGKVSMSLLLVEIDAFRMFRADYGPLRAETCRAGVEAAIRATLPRSASFVGRHGIGRFVVVAPDCPILLARAAASRMGADVLGRCETFTGSAHGLVTISVGVATANPMGPYAFALLDAAERALVKARERGHGRIEAIDLRGDHKRRLAAV